ncbi:MAG: hypothetical protein R3C99_28415, partial [Pirellulaceae bacterium]
LIDYRRGQIATLGFLADPQNEKLRTEALTSIRTCEEDLLRLADDVQQTIPLADLGRDKSLPPSTELRVVLSSVRQRRIEALLARADLYPTDSDDALAAAVEAAEQAEQLLKSLAPDESSHRDAVRLLSQSWVRAGDARKALTALQPLMPRDALSQRAASVPKPADLSWQPVPETRALLVRIALLDREPACAKLWLDAYYHGADSASTAKDAPPSLDLARLEYLLFGDRPDIQAAADWAEAIQARHGAYEGRLASLKLMSAGSSTTSDARVAAASAAAMLRRGETMAAANQYMLAASQALSDQQPEAAFEYRLQAAAAFQKAKDHEAASNMLVLAARSLPSHVMAEAAHLQAILLRTNPANEGADLTNAKYREMLEFQIETWPTGEHSERSRLLLSHAYEKQRLWAAAARLWTTENRDLTKAGRLWRMAIRNAGDPASGKNIFDDAVNNLPNGSQRMVMIALWGDRSDLIKLQTENKPHAFSVSDTTALNRFAQDVIRLRIPNLLPATDNSDEHAWEFI